MATFIGTVIIVGLCCLVMSLGLVFSGKPIAGGCGRKAPNTPKCEACPRRKGTPEKHGNQEGETEC